MDLSVVIVNWNGGSYLLDCLESLYARGLAGETEVLVVDNGSEDGSPELLQRSFPQVALIETGANLGFARAANLGWRRARGEYVLFLNPDVLVLEGALDQALTYFRCQPQVGVLGVKLLNPDGSLQVSCWNFLSLTTLVLDNLLRLPWVPRPLAGRYLYRFWDHGETREVDWIFGAFLLFRRQVLEEVGGFDEDYFMYGEDMDLCYRVQQRGYDVVYYSAAAIIHYGNLSGEKRWAGKREAEVVRTELTFLHKHRGSLSWFLFRVLAGGAFLAKTAFFGLRGHRDNGERWRAEAARYWQMARVCLGTESTWGGS
jgi:GT2 family glycosyltransferase